MPSTLIMIVKQYGPLPHDSPHLPQDYPRSEVQPYMAQAQEGFHNKSEEECEIIKDFEEAQLMFAYPHYKSRAG